jgi:hypothetical protein
MPRVWCRFAVCVALVSACGGDSSGPNDVFPDAAGVYNASGTFDGISSSDANFSGTLTLTQASRASGTLGGSAAYLARVSGNVFNITDDQLDGASVSPSGVITYTIVEGSSTWTFTGTLSGTSIVNGRHTLSTSSGSSSGAWSATRAGSNSRQMQVEAGHGRLEALARRLTR